jgi:hypothetical protein
LPAGITTKPAVFPVYLVHDSIPFSENTCPRMGIGRPNAGQRLKKQRMSAHLLE